MDRREVLHRIGIGASAVAIPGIASAKRGRPDHAGKPSKKEKSRRGRPDHAGPPSWAKVNHGRLEMAMSKSEYAKLPDPEQLDCVPDEAKRMPYEGLQVGLSAINRLAEEGSASIDSQTGEIRISGSIDDDYRPTGGDQ